MTIMIPGAQGLADLTPLTLQAPAQPHGNGFGNVLREVNDILGRADQLAAAYAGGKAGLTDAVLASEKADTTFQLVTAVRNRALAAYQEIANLQV